jgi:cytochrome P450
MLSLCNRLEFIVGKEGLITTHGTVWQNHRQLINPGFHVDSVKAMLR